METITSGDDQVQAMILDAISSVGAESVIRILAECCRVMAQGAIVQSKWSHAGTYNHYAQSLEDLLPESDSHDSSRTNARKPR